jgi:hypothetical protein
MEIPVMVTREEKPISLMHQHYMPMEVLGEVEIITVLEVQEVQQVQLGMLNTAGVMVIKEEVPEVAAEDQVVHLKTVEMPQALLVQLQELMEALVVMDNVITTEVLLPQVLEEEVAVLNVVLLIEAEEMELMDKYASLTSSHAMY